MAEYQTATGERRTVDLRDGNRIQLNSAIGTHLDGQRRLDILLHREILIDTGGDPQATPARPF